MPRGRKKKAKLTIVKTEVVEDLSRSDIENYLNGNNCFFCDPLKSKISKQYCVRRQLQTPSAKSAFHPQVKDTPQDIYCRSGECPVGNKIKKELKSLPIPATTVHRPKRNILPADPADPITSDIEDDWPIDSI